jgi:MFS transporter, SP family, solute carrier family 2 (myo-inositol transporter), member 13
MRSHSRNSATPMPNPLPPGADKTGYNRFLLLVAGLGGLLYGVDVGIIAGALPYLDATAHLNRGQESFIVAAVLLGSVFSTLFAGLLADFFGRKPLMAMSGFLFVASIPTIALSHGYWPLVLGRLLQGVSAGFIGVVVPLYLAECLGAANRGKGTGVFQWLLTLGISVAAAISIYFSYRVEAVSRIGNPVALLAFKDTAWRSIFWMSLPPGILFVIGSFFVAESPRWFHRRGKREQALASLLRSRTREEAQVELTEMDDAALAEKAKSAALGQRARESILKRKYVIPFVLACIILACNQATGINSIIGYNTTILIQSGLSDLQAHWGYLIFTVINFLVTIVGVTLVDRKGRKFLLSVGTAGVIVSLVAIGIMFNRSESRRVECKGAVQSLVTADQSASIDFSEATSRKLLGGSTATASAFSNLPKTLTVIYSYGDFRAATKVARSDDPTNQSIEIARDGCVPPNKIAAFFINPFANLEQAQTAPLVIENALISPVPSEGNGWLTLIFTLCFISFFAAGPGICVWLALSELMPTRIRSNGMSIALLVNQAVATAIAGTFLPIVGRYGYSTVFFAFAGCTVVYFATAAFLLPETKGRTLEEIELLFERP